MEEWSKCGIYYPLVKHPLCTEKDKLKEKYIALMEKYAINYDEKEFAGCKLQILQRSLFGEQRNEYAQGKYTQGIEAEVLRTRFLPFKFFSYRYIFLFDCLMLFAVSDEKKGKEICNDLKTHIHKRYHQRMDEMVTKMYTGDDISSDKTMIPEKMVQAWNDTRRFIRSKDREIIFTATMSAGKSTLINAIMGNSLSGTKKAACTSTVIRFHSSPVRNGLYAIINEEEKKCLFKDADRVQAYMKDRQTASEICGYFSSLFSQRRITLIDTPGVDSFLNPSHKDITRRELSAHHIEMIMYVIPVETYGSMDDHEHLTYIHKKISYDKIVFVVNMMDTFDPEDDTVEDMLSDIREHLKEIGFQDPSVFPISAKAGLQLKQLLCGVQLSDNEKESAEFFQRRFSKEDYALGKYYPDIDGAEKEAMIHRSCENYEDRIWSAYINTGLPGLEKILYDL